MGEFNSGSLVYSEITDNMIMCDSANGLHFEVATHDCIIARNMIGPNTQTTGGAIELSVASYSNQIIDNRIWGNPQDVTAGVQTIGIRTTGQAIYGQGNLVRGNFITDMMTGIAERGDYSIIEGNSITNSTSHAFSTGILTGDGGSDTIIHGRVCSNNINGFTSKILNSNSHVPIIQCDFGYSSVFEGNGTPEGVVSAAVGSHYHRLDGGAFTTFYVKESGTGNTGWAGYASAGTKNVALTINGSTSSASSTFSGFPTSRAIDGIRKGDDPAHGYWNDNTNATFDDWLEVDFAASSIIGEIDIFTVADDTAAPAEPKGGDIFTLYGITNFEVQYWNGAAWVTLKTITSNNRVWTQLNIPGGVQTTKIRVLVHAAAGNTYSRIAEVEAWTVVNTSLDADTIATGAGVSSFNLRSGAVLPATNDYTWAQINKSTSSLADITTRSAGDLSSGSLSDSRLSANVPLLNNPNVFLATNTFSSSLLVGWPSVYFGKTINPQTGTSYTIAAGDSPKLITFTNASSVAVTLPQAGGSFPNLWYIDVINLGAGTVTITPTTSTIDGASSLSLTTGKTAHIMSNGTNYTTVTQQGR